MKIFSFIVAVFLFFSCKRTEKEITVTNKEATKEGALITIPKINIHKDSLQLTAGSLLLNFNAKPFSGFAIAYHKNGIPSEKTGYYQGKKQGKSESWYADGLLIKEKYFANGVEHGTQKVWYTNGQIAEIRNINMGKESGLQQAWLRNGVKINNYEVVNGREFGMKKTQLCSKLENEKIKE